MVIPTLKIPVGSRKYCRRTETLEQVVGAGRFKEISQEFSLNIVYKSRDPNRRFLYFHFYLDIVIVLNLCNFVTNHNGRPINFKGKPL